VACHGGPKASPDGLVLALDGANFKSFKGEATTNEIVVVTWGGDGSNQASFVKESVLITDENLKYKGYETYLWSPGTSNNCYLNGADLSTSRTSTVWTFSCYVKRQDGAPITSLNVYMYYPTSDGSAAGTIQDVGNGWYRISRTRTGTDNYLSLIGFTGFVTGHKYYLSGAQLEKKSYPTTFVATNTTRGTTVATGGGWADLSGRGNNGTLVNGVGENSANGGSLVFDGVNDYINIPFSASTMDFSKGQTICMWMRPTTGSESARRNPYNQAYGGPGTLTHEPNRTINYYFGTNGGNTTPYVGRNSVFTVATNELAFISVTRDQTANVCRWYKNGQLISTQDAGGYASTANGSSPILIGAGYVSPFIGNIFYCKIYNRGLLPQEVQQNFIATKSRFGL
jgi:hypothetical protein